MCEHKLFPYLKETLNIKHSSLFISLIGSSVVYILFFSKLGVYL